MSIKSSKSSVVSPVPKKIGIRELVRNMTKVKAAVARGESFEVLDRTTPVFTITPTETKKTYKYTMEDLRNFRIKTDVTDLSSRVDEIVYGIKK